ncbi:MAG: YihY/virulence factor BrkB family protein [Anaerolineales bacterium]
MNEAPKLTEFLKGLYRVWITERPNQLAAGLAYFGMFSFAPMILIAFAVAGFFLDAASLMDQVFARLEAALGSEVAALILDMVDALDQPTNTGSILLSVVGFLALLYAASSFFFQLQFALNRIWRVPPPERGQTGAFIRQRLFSFLVVIALGLALVALALVNIIGTWLGSWLEIGIFDARLGIPAFGIAAALVFALLYKVLPDADISWRSVWLGAAIASALMMLGGALVIWLLGLGKINTGVAAAGAFIVVMLLIYFIAQIFLFGAIISREYASTYGSKS